MEAPKGGRRKLEYNPRPGFFRAEPQVEAFCEPQGRMKEAPAESQWISRAKAVCRIRIFPLERI